METRLFEHLDRRRREGNLRSLMPLPSYGERKTETGTQHNKRKKPLVDFASNDYLGLARCPDLYNSVQKSYHEHMTLQSSSYAQQPLLGATGSRLLSGDSNLARSLEKHLAFVHNRPSCLLFNSGYDANLSILSSLPYREDAGDAIVMDELVHNSLVMGARMGRLKTDRVFLFKHNDVTDLKKVLQTVRSSNSSSHHPSILVVVESVYSMDGDIAPLTEILCVCQDNGAELMVDEAHGLGVYGRTNARDMLLDLLDENNCAQDSVRENQEPTDGLNTADPSSSISTAGGTGVLAALNLESHSSLLCSIHTFGKAAGCHGAVVAGSHTLISYLINYARPFVYSTALPPHSLVSIKESYSSMMGLDGEKRRDTVFRWVKLFRREMHNGLLALNLFKSGIKLLPSPSPIQALIVPGNRDCVRVCQYLREVGRLDVYPIRTPTVPKGEERIRIILHAHNSEDEMKKLIMMVLISLQRYYTRSKL
ncbi:hypothetical protein HJC23_002543 [Cyclotella cryptica]|uniref:Aminotransferase class I/classII large domain-containing protein n=1 Tax=Cyclotella cryptica TaxID=29204 RepID=A0ABD3QVS0_9STRA|eukprot:CCRYP_001383-RA/>CCRYP_001383-RA protein AED:0.00 eAED:0.00 QI:258/-1/1/1/-1/1/1/476/479